MIATLVTLQFLEVRTRKLPGLEIIKRSNEEEAVYFEYRSS